MTTVYMSMELSSAQITLGELLHSVSVPYPLAAESPLRRLVNEAPEVYVTRRSVIFIVTRAYAKTVESMIQFHVLFL
jgi:hypothetical protein